MLPSHVNIFEMNRLSAAWSNKQRLHREEVVRLARLEWCLIRSKPDIIALLALYWAEGNKRTKATIGNFRITNSDPGIIVVAIKGLSQLSDKVPYLRIRLYPEHDEELCRTRWQLWTGCEVRGIERIEWRGSKKRMYSAFGVCQLSLPRPGDVWLKIMTWIDCWRNDFGISESCQL